MKPTSARSRRSISSFPTTACCPMLFNAYGLGKYVDDTALVKNVLERGHDELEGAGQHSAQSKLEDIRASVQFQRHRLQLAELFSLGDDDDLGLRRAAARGKRGRKRPRRAARPLFQTRRADGHQRLWHYRRPKSARMSQPRLSVSRPTSRRRRSTQRSKEITNMMPLSELQNPTKLNKLIEQFAANV